MATDDQQDLHAMSGAYALDALDQLESARFDRHLATCADCQEEVAGFMETAALLATAAPVAPPVALRARVLAEIATVRPAPPASVPAQRRPEELEEYATARDATAHHRARRGWASMAAVAASVALVVGIGVGAVTRPWQDDSPGQNQAADPLVVSVLKAPDAIKHEEPLGGGTATIVSSESVGRAVVQLVGVKAPSQRVYQLWLLRGKQLAATSAGVLPTESDQTVVLEGDAATARAAAISVEPVGGSTQPSPRPAPVVFPFEPLA